MIAPGTKVRPPCEICRNPALVFMNDAFYCGGCVAKIDKKEKQRRREEMKEMLR